MRAIVLGLVLLGACGPTGPRYAKVDPAQITAVQIYVVDGATTYCLGGDPTAVLGAVATLSDGRRLEMAAGAATEGRIPPASFEWMASWGRIDAGRLYLPWDPFAALDREVTVEVGVVDRPDLKSTLTLAPSFKCGGAYVATGSPGRGGDGGDSGTDGRDGGGGNARTRAGDGGDGQDGGRGGHGGNGGPGHMLRAWASFIDTERHGRLVAVLVVDGDRAARFLFDPAGRPFELGSYGGSGGGGGRGGSGGRGGNGGSYSDSTVEGDGGNGGNGGNGGDGADGGDGGAGGSIELVYDRRFPELARLVRVSTAGGAAGYAGDGGWSGSAGSGGSSSKGRSGQSGHAGSSGRRGRDGRPGPDGPPPVITAGDVRTAFGFLDELGLRLAGK